MDTPPSFGSDASYITLRNVHREVAVVGLVRSEVELMMRDNPDQAAAFFGLAFGALLTALGGLASGPDGLWFLIFCAVAISGAVLSLYFGLQWRKESASRRRQYIEFLNRLTEQEFKVSP